MDVWIDQKEASGPNDLLSTDDQSAILAAEQGRLGRLVERIDAYEAGLHAVKSGDPNNEASFMGRLELLRKILSEARDRMRPTHSVRQAPPPDFEQDKMAHGGVVRSQRGGRNHASGSAQDSSTFYGDTSDGHAKSSGDARDPRRDRAKRDAVQARLDLKPAGGARKRSSDPGAPVCRGRGNRLAKRHKSQASAAQPWPDAGPVEIFSSDDDAAPEQAPSRTPTPAPAPAAAGRARTRSGRTASVKTSLEQALKGMSYVYPEDGRIGSVEVTGHDLDTLDHTEFVNDTIMDYYSKRIFERYETWHAQGVTPVKLHFFTAFFYKKLTERGAHTVGDSDKDQYERVRKWTKKVDIFAMDYVLVPIHDAAHWSLAVICQPGNLRFEKMQQAQQTECKYKEQRPGNEAEMRELKAATPAPVILHLDSIRDGGHRSSEIGEALRAWLRMEWLSNAETKPDSVAARDYAQRAALPEARRIALEDPRSEKCINTYIAYTRVRSLPHQDNHHDCGLYTLAYMEFFSYRPPLHVHYFPGPLYRAEQGLVKWFGEEREDYAPFLTCAWFRQNNGYMLRFHLMNHLLEKMRERAFAEGRAEDLAAQISATTVQTDVCRGFMDQQDYHKPEEVRRDPKLQGPAPRAPRTARAPSLDDGGPQWTKRVSTRSMAGALAHYDSPDDDDDELVLGVPEGLSKRDERDDDYAPEGATLHSAGVHGTESDDDFESGSPARAPSKRQRRVPVLGAASGRARPSTVAPPEWVNEQTAGDHTQPLLRKSLAASRDNPREAQRMAGQAAAMRKAQSTPNGSQDPPASPSAPDYSTAQHVDMRSPSATPQGSFELARSRPGSSLYLGPKTDFGGFERKMRQVCPQLPGVPRGWIAVHNVLRESLYRKDGSKDGSNVDVSVPCAPLLDGGENTGDPNDLQVVLSGGWHILRRFGQLAARVDNDADWHLRCSKFKVGTLEPAEPAESFNGGTPSPVALRGAVTGSPAVVPPPSPPVADLPGQRSPHGAGALARGGGVPSRPQADGGDSSDEELPSKRPRSAAASPPRRVVEVLDADSPCVRARADDGEAARCYSAHAVVNAGTNTMNGDGAAHALDTRDGLRTEGRSWHAEGSPLEARSDLSGVRPGFARATAAAAPPAAAFGVPRNGATAAWQAAPPRDAVDVEAEHVRVPKGQINVGPKSGAYGDALRGD